MREKQFKEIDGHNYRCEMMSVRMAHGTFLTLCSTLGGPVVKSIAAGYDNMEEDLNRLIIGSISVALQNLDGPVGEELIESVFKNVFYVGDGTDKVPGFELKPWDDDFDRHFRGRILTMYKVWAWSVEMNYKDFLDGIPALGGDKAVGLVKQGLNSLLTPTSGSGQ